MELVVVDCETTGLDHRRHVVLEVAWWNLISGERGWFLPLRRPADIDAAEPVALEKNGFHQRLAHLPQDRDLSQTRRFNRAMQDARLIGANPGFDANFLIDMFMRNYLGPEYPIQPWHYRMLDIEAFAAGKLDLPVEELPSLRRVCELLSVPLDAAHTAAGDVTATGRCCLKLMSMQRDPVRPEDTLTLPKVSGHTSHAAPTRIDRLRARADRLLRR